MEKDSNTEGEMPAQIAINIPASGAAEKPISPLPTTKTQSTNQKLRYTSLIILALQNTTLVLLMRYARTLPGDQFFATTAVVMAEILKFVSCIIIITFTEGGIRGLFAELDKHIINQPLTTAKLAVPGLIYTFQNNLLFVAISNLPAATFQVVYQLKILTTALFSVSMLEKRLVLVQWIALGLLTAGVALVQIETQTSGSQKPSNEEGAIQQRPLVGFIAVIMACVSSGFSGVYFEKIMKSTPSVSIWVRNIQLAGYGIILGLVGVYVNDGDNVLAFGFFHGYNTYTYLVIANQALGGLTVAFVVKYADNILKGFATSIAIILSCICSIFIFDFQITNMFLLGATLVVGSVSLYSSR